jgi:hypothetical protein
MTRHTVIKSISIDRAPPVVQGVLSDPRQLPNWLFFDIATVHQLPSRGVWEIDASRQKGTLWVDPLPENHGVNFEVQLPEQNWFIPARIVPNEEGTTVLLTLIHSTGITKDQFARRVAFTVRELNLLKRLIES